MSRKMLLLAALPLLMSGATLAQTADQPPAAAEVPAPPPATDQNGNMDGDMSDPAESNEMDAAGSTNVEGDMSGGDAAAESDMMPDADGATSAVASGDPEILTEEGSDKLLADRLIGMPVVDPAGTEIGEVEDILLDKSGQVAGLVLSHGKVLGLGGKTVAVSWQDVASAEGSDAITLNLTEEQLAAAHEFRTREDVEREQIEQTAPAAGPGTATNPTEPEPVDQQ